MQLVEQRVDQKPVIWQPGPRGHGDSVAASVAGPTSGSWLNLVEVFFGIITRQAIRRGSFDSVKQLVTAIRAFIDAYNDRCQPFTWTKTAAELLRHCTAGKRTSFTRR